MLPVNVCRGRVARPHRCGIAGETRCQTRVTKCGRRGIRCIDSGPKGKEGGIRYVHAESLNITPYILENGVFEGLDAIAIEIHSCCQDVFRSGADESEGFDMDGFCGLQKQLSAIGLRVCVIIDPEKDNKQCGFWVEYSILTYEHIRLLDEC